MGTPSRVKGGLQEMRTVVELMGTTVRLLTDSGKSVRETNKKYQAPESIFACLLPGLNTRRTAGSLWTVENGGVRK